VAAASAIGRWMPSAERLLCDLVREPTEGPGPALDRAIGHLVEALEQVGVGAAVEQTSAGLPMVRAVVGDDRRGPSVLFQGHLDVVPPGQGWTVDPYAARVVDGVVWGRGTCDMKGGLVASVLAIAVSLELGGPPLRTELLVSPDEESGSDRGLLPYLEEVGVAPHDIAVCAEPTGGKPFLGNRGLVWMTVRLRGAAAHAGIPSAGRNPVPALADLIRSLPRPVADVPEGIAPPSLTPTLTSGSDAINVIPAVATLGLDRRLVPGEDPQAAIAEVDRAVREVTARHDGIEGELEVLKIWPPCSVEADDPYAMAALEAARSVRSDAAFGFDDAANDASFLSAAGTPTLVWGPGAPEFAHAADERIALDEIAAVATMYLAAIERWSELEPRGGRP
jgi:succinyl-diaminopimelate desuccinylase